MDSLIHLNWIWSFLTRSLTPGIVSSLVVFSNLLLPQARAESPKQSCSLNYESKTRSSLSAKQIYNQALEHFGKENINSIDDWNFSGDIKKQIMRYEAL